MGYTHGGYPDLNPLSLLLFRHAHTKRAWNFPKTWWRTDKQIDFDWIEKLIKTHIQFIITRLKNKRNTWIHSKTKQLQFPSSCFKAKSVMMKAQCLEKHSSSIPRTSPNLGPAFCPSGLRSQLLIHDACKLSRWLWTLATKIHGAEQIYAHHQTQGAESGLWTQKQLKWPERALPSLSHHVATFDSKQGKDRKSTSKIVQEESTTNPAFSH